MRELTFKGFLAEYVMSLAEVERGSIRVLAREAGGNARLRAPLYLYAAVTGRGEMLFREARGTVLFDEYAEISRKFDVDGLLAALKEQSAEVPEEYLKVWRSYESVRDAHLRDDRMKALICEKVLQLQAEKSLSTYRICKDLRLDNANVNAWLKNNACGKVSLATAKSVLRYMESADFLF